jgi:serine/threonine protein kinase
MYMQADVYSFGVTLWELLERKRPYKGLDPYQIQVPAPAHCKRAA